MPNLPVCVDANIVVAMVTAEQYSRSALTLWREWTTAGQQAAAPRLLRYEVTSALHRKVLRGTISQEDARQALQEALSLDVLMIDPADLSPRALELAAKFRRPATYDAHYLALAEHLDCPLWTADERLYNAVHADFDRIRWLGNYQRETRNVTPDT